MSTIVVRGAAEASKTKPRWRGWSHLAAFFAACGASPVLVFTAPHRDAAWAATVYAICLVTLFGVSALYHRHQWGDRARAWMRRCDHAAIFMLIAGTATPLYFLTMPSTVAWKALGWMWGAAALGIVQKLLWIKVPKLLSAVVYLGVGWLGALYLPKMATGLGPVAMVLLIAGGLCYTVGALVYALRWPDPRPASFGYHEIFHVLVIVASLCHFTAILGLLHR